MNKVNEIIKKAHQVSNMKDTSSVERFLEEMSELRVLIESAVSVPAGWKLMPIEPDEMSIQAGCLNQATNNPGNYERWDAQHSYCIVEMIRNIIIADYKVMINAAPDYEDNRET